MTRTRSISRSHSEGQEWCQWLLVVGLVFLLSTGTFAGGGAGATAGDSVGQSTTVTPPNQTNQTYPPPNLHTRVVIIPRSSSVKIYAGYPARSVEERQQYGDETANLTWFTNDEELERGFKTRGEHLDKEFVDTFSRTSVRNPELGEVDLYMKYTWKEGGATTSTRSSGSSASRTWYEAYRTDPSKVVLGPALSRHLSNGTVVEIEVSSDIRAASSTVPSHTTGPHGGIRVYSWTVNQTEREPRVVFNESALEIETPSSADGPLGPASGVGLSLLAIVVTVSLLSRAQRT